MTGLLEDKSGERHQTMGKMNTFTLGVVAGLIAAAVGQELAKDPQERTWRGKVAGIPYNFNLDSFRTIAGEYWDPESDQILTPHVIGMGWGINFAAVLRWLQSGSESSSSERERPLPPPHQITEPAQR
jgi:hypothetical protein